MKRMVSVLVASIIGLSSSAQQSGVAPHTIRVGYLPATHDSLLFIAHYYNLFPTNLNVRMLPYKSSSIILTDMRGEQVDVGIPGVAAPAKFIAGGAPFEIIGGAAQESAAVVVRAEFAAKFAKKGLKPIDKMRLFTGLKIGSVKLSTGDALFRYAIKDNDIKSISLNDSYQDPKDLLNDLKGEKLDAAVLWSPHMTTAENEGNYIALWLGDILQNHVCCRQVVRSDYISQYRASVVEYLDGLIEAMILYSDKSNRSRVIKAVSNYIKTDPSVIETELYGNGSEKPRTTVSVDLNPGGMRDYLHCMSKVNLATEDDCATVTSHLNDTMLIEAYMRHGLDQKDARKAVYQGFESVKGLLKPRPQDKVKP